MAQMPSTGRRTRRTQTHTYEGTGERIAASHSSAAPRRPAVTRASTARQPMGRSEELRERQRAYQQTYRQPEPQERRFRQPVDTNAVYDDFDVYDRDARKVYSGGGNYKRRDQHNGLWAVVIFICLLFTGAIGLFLAPQLLGWQYATMPNCAFVNGSVITMDQARYDNYKEYRQYMENDTFFPGVYVDGVHLAGMSMDQARQAVGQVGALGGGDFAITVNIGNKSWSIDSGKVPMTRNVDQVLSQAYALGRSNTTAIRGTRVTPFQERLNTVANLQTAPVSLTTSLTYDKATIRQLTDSIAAFVNRDPVNASVATFDFNTRGFTFNSDSPGSYIDGDALYDQVIAMLEGGQKYATVVVEPQIVLASVTKAELMNSFKKISSYTTETTSNSNRNTNVMLSAAAINGTTVLPGETFSFNRATGQRTAEKGYLPAAAIAGGQSIDEIGGGVCQTSSTLFNAVARANMEIVDRSPHAWPSNYVDKGLDATVNWPNLDFKFKNTSDWPIFIVAYYEKRKVTVEIYGMSLGDGVSIDLTSKVTYTSDPPREPKYVLNPELAPGEQKTTIQARKGYEVDTYKIWYQNGQEVKRETLFKSTYRMYQETIEYNDYY
ncbi:MAG: hypothetical protein E7316_04760 [Clostridiales bacterium]|nr:hypothetical protein [Clostridiales bacterium]